MSTLRAVHQVVPSFGQGDGVGMHALQVRTALRELGLDAEVFAYSVDQGDRGEVHRLEEIHGALHDDAAVLYHYAIACPAIDVVLRLPVRRGLVYQNPTPERWFLDVSRRNWERCRSARLELPWVTAEMQLGMALSEFSRRELDVVGIPHSVVCPPIVDAAAAGAAPRRPQPATIVGVGRLAPSKAWELALRAMAALRRTHREATFELIGSDAEMEPYANALRELALRLDAGTLFRGRVSQAEREDAYARATAVVLPSAHEGFGIPVLEAMARGIPVVATRHGAIPEVAGGAALLTGDDPLEMAEALRRVLDDAPLRAALAGAGRRRAAEFTPELLRSRVAAAIAPWREAS